MGTNLRPGAGRPIFPVEAHPEKMDEVIERQGQYVRIILSRKCPNLAQGGKHNLYCDLCGGRGALLSYQRRARVFEERILDRYASTPDRLHTWWRPIIEVEKVMLHRHSSQGGNIFFTSSSFSGNEIVLTGVDPPKYWERVLVTYWYDRWESVSDERITSNGTSTITVTKTEISTENTSNPFLIYGDLTEITQVRNLNPLHPYTYTVKGFDRQNIYLDSAAPGYVNVAGDVISVSYWFCGAAKIATEMIDTQERAEKIGHDIKVGDVMSTIPSYYDIGEGDLVTFLASELRKEAVIIRGAGNYDEFPEFDVTRIADNFLLDETGARYTFGTDFVIQQYNNLVWLAGRPRPVQGKRYTVVFYYRPTYRVFMKGPSYNRAENKAFPMKVFLRSFEKVRNADFSRVDGGV